MTEIVLSLLDTSHSASDQLQNIDTIHRWRMYIAIQKGKLNYWKVDVITFVVNFWIQSQNTPAINCKNQITSAINRKYQITSAMNRKNQITSPKNQPIKTTKKILQQKFFLYCFESDHENYNLLKNRSYFLVNL